MSDCYKWLIIGATFTGLGAAYACKNNNVLIIERTSQVGYEYINSYNPGTDWNYTELSHEESKRLKEELLEREILSEEGLVHIPALAPVLYNRIKQDNIPVILMTDIINISGTGKEFEVEVYNTSGFSRFKALNIIDTTYNCITYRSFRPQVISKRINAMIYNSQNPDNFDPHCQDLFALKDSFIKKHELEFAKGKFEWERILKMRIEPEDDWVSARQKLHRLWSIRPDAMKSWIITAVADHFEVKVDKGPIAIERKWDLLPSCSYNNPLESFEAGIRYILSKEAD